MGLSSEVQKRIWDNLSKPILSNSAKYPYLAHFAEFCFGKVGIEIRQSGHRNLAKWASKFGKLGIEIRQKGQGSCLNLQKQPF